MNAPQPVPPANVTRVRDRDGDEWVRTDAGLWADNCSGGPCSWASLWDVFGPLEWDEATLPLPTVSGPFWGRVQRNGSAYIGWLMGPDEDADFYTPRPVDNRWHHRALHVTRLPIPDDVKEALR